MKIKILVALLVVSASFTLIAQEKELLDSLAFYGKLRVHTAVFDDEIELQQNSPRVGLFLQRSLLDDFKVEGKLEYGMNIIDGTQFNNDANNVIEFASQPFVKKETFSSRLAFIGVSHPKWGRLTAGKQWGVYYDIASYTDNFTVFGGESNGVYSGQTDGGWKGTGRADNAIAYRNSYKNLSVGIQTQLFSGNTNFAGALQYQLPFNLSLGFSYNHAEIRNAFREFIEFERKINENYLFGAKYKKDNFQIAATYSINHDEFALLDSSDDSFRIVAYPTHGLELFSNYYVNKKIEIQAGFNRINDVEDNSFFEGDYSLMHYILGINYHITPNTIAYTSARIGDSKLVNNARDSNVFLVGFSFNFSYKQNAIKL